MKEFFTNLKPSDKFWLAVSITIIMIMGYSSYHHIKNWMNGVTQEGFFAALGALSTMIFVLLFVFNLDKVLLIIVYLIEKFNEFLNKMEK